VTDLTPEQQQIVDQLRADLSGWVERELLVRSLDDLDPTPYLRRRCEELNELPLEERLQRLAWQHDADLDGVVASVADVKWRYDTKAAKVAIITEVKLRATVQQVYFTVKVG
jgi:hypothetical protein